MIKRTAVSLIRPWKTITGETRLLCCFPYAGGGASIYRQWHEILTPYNVSVCSVALPGREEDIDLPLYTRLTTLVKDLADELVAYSTHPMTFFGHSLGALVAFELTHELARRHMPPPAHLILSGCRAPHLPSPFQAVDLYDDRELLALLLRLNVIPKEAFAHQELMSLFLPRIRADFEMILTYRFEAGIRLACPMSVYGGQDDATIQLADLLAWRDYAGSFCHLRLFPGAHLYPWEHQEEFLHALIHDIIEGAKR